VTTAFARPSFAAATPSILFPVRTSICSKIVRAFWLSQPGTNWSGPFLKVPFLNNGLSTESYPLLNRCELLSVGPPFSLATTGSELYLPFAFRPLTTPCPWSTPTCLPWKEM
jgi:hypothetical protein